MERRLAAVLIADVVGYSRLMQLDETGTLAGVRERISSIIEPVARAHGGRIVKVMGDGVLMEFGSAVNAVSGAVDVQRKMTQVNVNLPQSHQIVWRIGINLGDVIGEGEDIFGNGVNLAARLEALAEPGGICVSAKVHEEVRGKAECTFEDMGEQFVKNLLRPVRVYRLHANGATLSEEASVHPPLRLPSKPSIVVLPFQNMSGDAEQDYFADGMVEDITTALSRLKWLFVIARNSSFTYKGRAVDIKQVGRELGVRYVVEGSVRKAGNKVRITGQLIDASTGSHLWADRFDGEFADIFDLQDHVTSSIVGAISPKLEEAEIARTKQKPTENLDAYDYFLRGMSALHQFSKEANEEALKMFYLAIERDPRYSSALGMAARCYAQRKGFSWVIDSEKEVTETERLARLAAESGSDDAVALYSAGWGLAFVVGNLDDGSALIDRALALNPNLAAAAHLSAITKAFLGESKEAIELATRAIRLSPQDPQMFALKAAKAFAHYFSGHYEEAWSLAQAALSERTNFFMAQCVAAASAALAGKQSEAAKAMARFRELNPKIRLGNFRLEIPIKRSEDLERWKEGLRKAGLPE